MFSYNFNINGCLFQENVQTDLENVIKILIYKNGDPTDLENYQAISLLSEMYKSFMKIVTNRLDKKFEMYQSIE